MALIVDIVIIAIVAFIVWRSAVHGFVCTVIEMLGYILAAVLSITLSGMAADVLYTNTIRPMVITSVEEQIYSAGVNTEEQIDALFEELPSFVTGITKLFGAKDEVISNISRSISSQTSDLPAKIADTVIQPVVVNTVKMLLSTVIFIVLFAVVKFLAKHINKFFRIPILSSVNSLLGGIIGLAKAFVIVGLVVFIIRIAVTSMGRLWIFDEDLISETYLFGFMYNLEFLN